MSLPLKDNHCSHFGMFLVGLFSKAVKFSELEEASEMVSPQPSFPKKA